jgi:signal transduction histidine kinase
MLGPAGHVNEAEEPAFVLNPLRLSFRTRLTEEQFQHENIVESLNIIRVYLCAAAALYLTFGILDAITGDPSLPTLLLIRCGIVCPILLASCAATFHPAFPKYSQPILAFAMISPGLGVAAMTYIMAAPFNNLYYAGLIMVVMYGSCLVRLRYTYAAAVTAILFGAYQVSALYLNPIPFKLYISNNFFLTMASMVGLFSGYLQELYIRKTYAGQKTIEAKNALSNILLIESQKANKSKSDFLANMSHELRTPLNAIIGFSEIIGKELLGPNSKTQYSEYARDINSSGLHLLAIINEILDLAKAESGKVNLSEEDMDVLACVEDCIRTCRNTADVNGIRLTFANGLVSPKVHADRRLIFQIVLNLISNAVKFTPAGGSVEVRVHADDRHGVSIMVADTGVGIAAENLDRVMRPFEQIENSYSRSHGGTGLGLPYSAKLAELHEGSIRLESKVGHGTTATLWLPPARLVSAKPILRVAS